MEKITFTWILECALLRWDGYTEKQMRELGASPIEITGGVELYNYLKPINVDSKKEKEKQTDSEIELNSKQNINTITK